MSLINKVLRDLDARSTTRGPSTPKTIHRGLRPATPGFNRKGPVWLMLALTVVVTVIVYIGVSVAIVPLPYSGPVLAAIGLMEKPEVVTVATAPVTSAKSSTTAPLVDKPVVVTPVSVKKPVIKPENTISTKKPVAKKPPKKVVTRKPAAKKKVAVKQKPAIKPKKKVVVAAKNKGELKKRVKPISAAEKAENAFREGAIAMEQGNQALAEQKLRLTLKHNTRHAKAYELLAGVLISSGRSADGQRVLADSLARLPGHAQLSSLLARLYVDQGRDAEAIRVLEQAQKKNTLNAQLMSFRAAMYQRGGRYTDAAKAYRDALTVVPNEGKWWVGLAISLEAQRDWTGARSAYEKAQKANLSPQLAQYAQQRLAAVKASK